MLNSPGCRCRVRLALRSWDSTVQMSFRFLAASRGSVPCLRLVDVLAEHEDEFAVRWLYSMTRLPLMSAT